MVAPHFGGGTVTGAAVGAAAGSVAGPVGTVAGGIIGGLGGLAFDIAAVAATSVLVRRLWNGAPSTKIGVEPPSRKAKR